MKNRMLIWTLPACALAVAVVTAVVSGPSWASLSARTRANITSASSVG
jgi:hypothetical protein